MLGRAKFEDPQASVDRLEDLMRRYSERRDAKGVTHTLAEDIKMASLDALLPEDLERRIHLNRARLATHEALRNEIVNYSGAMAPLS